MLLWERCINKFVFFGNSDGFDAFFANHMDIMIQYPYIFVMIVFVKVDLLDSF
jgi:hypothetical protein